MVWPYGHVMGHGMVLWYNLVNMALFMVIVWRAWHMVWPGKDGMVYDMVLRAWHGLCSGLVGMAWYMVLLGGHGMVYGLA